MPSRQPHACATAREVHARGHAWNPNYLYLRIVGMTEPWVGKSLPRREDERLLRGQGRYVADIEVPGMAHIVFVRSPFAHAVVSSIDATEALALPGVVAVLGPDDLPTGTLPPFLWDTPPEKLINAVKPEVRHCHPPLMASTAHYVGEIGRASCRERV